MELFIALQVRFKLDDDVSLSDMIRDLQDAKMGDPRRLSYIMERIESDRPIYNSDEQYVREKFRQLREEITRESENIPDVPPDSVVPSDPPPSILRKDEDHPSRAWYILPIVLGVLGGLIAYAKLRKRNRNMSYKTLGLGAGITMLFLVPMLASDIYDMDPTKQSIKLETKEYVDPEPDREPSSQDANEDIKRQAVIIPYKSLMEKSEIYVGEIVRYEGTVIQVTEPLFTNNYILRMGLTQERFGAEDVVWLNYKPPSDEDKMWLETIEVANPFSDAAQEKILIWGVSKGLKTYSGLFGSDTTIPEIDVIILERSQDAPQVNNNTIANQPSMSHTISFSAIPTYVDESTVERAVIDAAREWDMANPNVDFTIVDSNGDVNINWTRYMPGSALGLHRASVTDDGTREGHSITVRLGIDDCNSTYQQFTHGAFQYIIAHEIGHYLGLRHIDDKLHLMYSGELVNVDSARVYDNKNLGIPNMERPEIMTVDGLEIQSQIDVLDRDLTHVFLQRQELKSADNVSQQVLDDATDKYNTLAQSILELENQLICVNIN